MWIRKLTVLFALLFAAAWTGVAVAQDTPDDAPPAQTQQAQPEPVPPGLASPRATMRTFLVAFDPAKRDPDRDPLAVAASCLDLSQIPEDLRELKGRELAIQLKEVLDRTLLVDFSTIPAAPDAEPYSIEVPDVEASDVEGEIVLAPDARGVWRFTAETVVAVPALLAATEDREIVEGVQRAGQPQTPATWLRAQMPPSLRRTGFLLEHWQWLGLLTLALLGMALDRLVTSLVQVAISRYLARRMETIDDDELKQALRPLGLFAASLLWWAGIFWLGLPTHVLEVLVVAVKFVAASSFVWAAYRTVDIVAAVLQVRAARSANRFDDLLVPLVRKSLKVFIFAFGLVFVADTLDLPIRSVIAGLGIGGLAVALAAQDAVKNLFGSVMVIVDRPFAVGDWVKIDDVEGTVADLGFRSTRIRTFYDSLITLPNSNLINAAVDNYGARQFRRWSTYLSLTYDTPPEKVEEFCEGVRELIRSHPHTRKESFYVYLNQFGPSSLDVLLYLFFVTPDWQTELQERHRLSLDILRLARDLGVEFAFPTQTLYLHRPDQDGPGKGTEPADAAPGGRAVSRG